MLDVAEALQPVPSFKAFCSVEALHTLVETLRTDSPSSKVEVADASANGLPIHHGRFSTGSSKVPVVVFHHCMEPISRLIEFTLMTLLHQGKWALLGADVEWHVVPCIEPCIDTDGALLNEGSSQTPVTLENHVKPGAKTPVTGLKAAGRTDSVIVTEAMTDVLKLNRDAAEGA